MRYDFGSLWVEVEGLGKLKPPWDPFHERWAYHLEARDTHGHSFEAGWYSERLNPKWVAARLISLLWTAVHEREFVEEFHGGYRGEEGKWRREEAYRLRSAGREFDDEELTHAAAIANRRREFEEGKGPRDWSPKGEFPQERLTEE